MRNLSVIFPSMIQQAPLLPFKHKASESVSNTFLNRWAEQVFMIRKARMVNPQQYLVILQYVNFQVGYQIGRQSNNHLIYIIFLRSTSINYNNLLMAEFTIEQIRKITEERSLTADQINTLQKAAVTYYNKISKQELLATYRKFAYMSNLLEADLEKRLGSKKEKPVRISYDLLPSGKVENFQVQEIQQ